MSMTQNGTTYYLTYDQVGSLRVVADTAGNMVKRIDYDSFGNIIADSNPGVTVPFGFAGGLHDRDTGLVRFGFRDYDPNVGRWTAKDPIGFEGGNVDLYGYCLNDPVNLLDPLGLYSFQQFLGDTAGYAAVAGVASVFTPGGQTAATVFFGISAGATALEIGLYSQNPYVETLREAIKMLIPIKEPFNMFSDEAINQLFERLRELTEDEQQSENNRSPCE